MISIVGVEFVDWDRTYDMRHACSVECTLVQVHTGESILAGNKFPTAKNLHLISWSHEREHS